MGMDIILPGALTTVQDLGRIGYQESGFTPSGVMDQKAGRTANILVGNKESEAVLEMTLFGAKILFLSDNVIAVTGGNMEPRIEYEKVGRKSEVRQVPMYEAVSVHKGEMLVFGMAVSGCRTYIACAGGLDIPIVMGSRSTNLKCSLGGYRGRKLQSNDIVYFRNPVRVLSGIKKRKIKETVDNDAPETVIRVIPGPQEEYFTTGGTETFYSQSYVVSPENDRMGMKLNGPKVEYKEQTDIISDGIVFGSIQIPSGGAPIIMMADHQTTGGYAKIGTVASVDLPKMAQSKAGDRIRFEKIAVGTGQRLCRRQAKELQKLAKICGGTI